MEEREGEANFKNTAFLLTKIGESDFRREGLRSSGMVVAKGENS
jgi:hypothetical protein